MIIVSPQPHWLVVVLTSYAYGQIGHFWNSWHLLWWTSDGWTWWTYVRGLGWLDMSVLISCSLTGMPADAPWQVPGFTTHRGYWIARDCFQVLCRIIGSGSHQCSTWTRCDYLPQVVCPYEFQSHMETMHLNILIHGQDWESSSWALTAAWSVLYWCRRQTLANQHLCVVQPVYFQPLSEPLTLVSCLDMNILCIDACFFAHTTEHILQAASGRNNIHGRGPGTLD